MEEDDLAPRLPPPAIPEPVAVVPPAPAPALIDEFGSNRQIPGAHHAASRAASRRPRGRRAAVAAIAAIVLVGVGGAIAVAVTQFDRQSSTPSAINTSSPRVMVETADFSFSFATEPTSEALETNVAGLQLSGTAWTVDTDDQLLQVLAIDFGTPLDEMMAQASFDASNGGMARRAGGNIISDEIITDGVVWGRRAVIEFDGGRLFVTNYAKGRWIVSITAGGSGSRQPAEYDDLVASFAFR